MSYNRQLLSQRYKLIYKIAVKYYRIKRYFLWYLGNKKFSNTYDNTRLPFNIKYHSSVLIRKLGESEMWLQHNKIKNLSIAIKKINGILIRPGEVFSFCKLVGLPTIKKGYVEGMEISQGVPRPGIGGGICQISNLIYWLVLHSDLDVIERSHHGFDPFPDHNRVLPFASGATVFYNYIDLQIKNNTKTTFQINLWITSKCLEGEIRASEESVYTYSVFEKNHRFKKEGMNYFRSNEIWRNKMARINGKFIKEEFICKNNAQVKYIPSQFQVEKEML
jgi:vancomycin resistance protein VanW